MTATATQPNVATRHAWRPGRTGVSHPGQCRDLNLGVMLRCSLPLKSGVRVASILVVDFFSLLSLFPFHCRLHSPHPSLSFSTPPSHTVILHSPLPFPPNLFSQSSRLGLGLPLLLLPSTLSGSALFINCSHSIQFMCPAHFNRFLTSFLLRAKANVNVNPELFTFHLLF